MDLTAAPYGGARYPVEARFPQFPARLYNPGVLFGKRVCQSKEPSGQESHGAAVPSNDLIEAELKKVLSSQIFVNSPQLCRFLRFIVEQEIAGEGAGLKEYVLGIEVLKKDESFDPRIDTAVRTEARRLRQKLAEYYQAEGRNDSIEIALPKGSYRATFHTRPLSGSPISAAPSQPTRVPQTRIALGALLCIAGVGAWWLWTSVSAKPHLPSIAVIPLENLSADPEQEYFSDGMTDALFTDLAKLHGYPSYRGPRSCNTRGRRNPLSRSPAS